MGVVHVCGDFVLEHGGEVGLDGSEEAWGDVVRAHGAADRIIVQSQLRLELRVDGAAGILDDVTGPGAASAGCVKAL